MDAKKTALHIHPKKTVYHIEKNIAELDLMYATLNMA